MNKILIIGCGDIGIRLAKILFKQGHKVFGLRRNPPLKHAEFITYISADIRVTKDLEKLALDFTAVFYMPSPDQRKQQSYEQVFVHGLNNLLQVFSNTESRPHIFYISSTSVYSQNQGQWVDENSVIAPEQETAKVIAAGEQLIWQHNTQNTVIRFSGIYGEGRSQLLTKLDLNKKIQYEPPYYTNRIHQDDCASVLGFLYKQLINGVQLQPCYLASDDQPTPIWNVLTWLARHMGKSNPQHQEHHDDAKQNKRCCNKRLKQLGFVFIYPSYREGYRSLIEDQKQQTL